MIVVDPSGVTFVTLDFVHAVIFSLSKSTTLYVVYVWGDRCGREVPHYMGTVVDSMWNSVF